MKNLNWLGRLGWHGGKLVLLTVVIVLVRFAALLRPSVTATAKGALKSLFEPSATLHGDPTHQLDDLGYVKYPGETTNEEWFAIKENMDAVWGKPKW